jgi:energy-coupling factor transporter ATP-binding protein EcfA2
MTVEPATPLWSDNPSVVDLLGFADIAAPVLEAVSRDRLDPVAVGIVGWWGSGKSTILGLIESALREQEGVLVVSTRPWEYDPATDPKATLIAEVLTVLHQRADASTTLSEEIKDRFKKLAARVRWSKAITLAANTALTFSLPKIQDVVDIFGKGEEPEDPTLQGFREEFTTLLADFPEIKRVVVVVDDLDRCLPPAVIAALEAIKLFLSVEKMAFVLAYDDRLVTHAIAERYQPSPRATEMASEYLEKIVQIPVPVPTLGLGDTEAYLALTLLETHMTDGDAFAKVVEHCEGQRRAGEAQVFEKLPDGLIPESAAGDVALALMLAPILFRELGGNPRRLKRFLNSYWIRATIARSRGITLEPAALAKLMVLEQLYPDEFERVLGWLTNGELDTKLAALEGAAEHEKGESADEASPKLKDWAELPPPLAAVGLEPYLRLAAALHRVAAGVTGLRADLRELADNLSSSSDQTRKPAQETASGKSLEDRVDLVRELVRRMRLEPQRQNDYGDSIGKLAQSSAEVATEAVALMRDFDVAEVKVALPIRLVVDPANPTPAMVELLSEWATSDRLPAVVGRAIEEATKNAAAGTS